MACGSCRVLPPPVSSVLFVHARTLFPQAAVAPSRASGFPSDPGLLSDAAQTAPRGQRFRLQPSRRFGGAPA